MNNESAFGLILLQNSTRSNRLAIIESAMSNIVYLTKSRYAAGLQCLRRLWLNVHEPAEWEEPEAGSAQDVGLEIGRMAHLLFPGGVLVEEKPWEHAAAVARTALWEVRRLGRCPTPANRLTALRGDPTCFFMDITEVENRRVRAVIDAWFAEEELPDMGETTDLVGLRGMTLRELLFAWIDNDEERDLSERGKHKKILQERMSAGGFKRLSAMCSETDWDLSPHRLN
jgi:hypothetical protein